ncbi:MAG: flagellar hook-length control protein FliK [Gammaproteobacteria bacterium]|nr:flagellar hook-length control protein FliK [Gammaproteobacteria bacterium]
MNQINLDALLQIGTSRLPASQQSLKLTPDTLYQALLHIGNDGGGQLHVVTPQGPVQIQLTPQQTALLLQSTPQGQTLTPNQSLATQVTLQGQLAGQAQSATTSTAAQTPGAQIPATNTPLQLQIQLQPSAAGQLELQSQRPAVQIPLQPSQLLQLLGSQQQTLTVQVQIQRQQQQLLLTFPNQQQLQIPATWVDGAADWPAQPPKLAQLTVQLAQGQLKISVTVANPRQQPTQATEQGQGSIGATKSATVLSPTLFNTQLNPAKPATTAQANALAAAATGQSLKPQVLSAAQTTALLPELAKVLQPGAVTNHAGQLQLGKLELPHLGVKSHSMTNWQLQSVPSTGKAPGWQLQLSADAGSGTPLKIDSTALNRPVQWQQAPTLNSNVAQTGQMPAAKVDLTNAWRQWLPLSNPTVDPLLELPHLPPAVNAILKELKAQTLDVARPIQQAQLQQQLTAALQFNPLQQLTQTNSSASTLAVALQLLLGRLANQPNADVKSNPAQRLQNLVAQLDQTQSGQLLKQLAGHASKMQGAQFATAEQAQSPQQHQPLFIQLPLVQQGESRFAELALTEREADGKAGAAKRQQWQLTMKFDLGDAGHLLVQVRLTGLEVSLQFYAEQAQIVNSAEQFLPLLKDRLKMQGLEVTEAQCQLGKIPEQLFARSNSLLAVRV